MFPFVLAGKIIGMFKPLDKEYDFFMFFPIYGIGGAEKVNADVVASLPDKEIIIFFTRHSNNDKMLQRFQKPNVTLVDISRWTDNKFMYWANLAWRGICAHHINSQKKKPVIFSGQCNFGYKLFPHIRKDILKTELIHNSVKQFAWVIFPYVPFINKRVSVADCIINKHKEYYRELGIPTKYDERFVKIFYTTGVPEEYVVKNRSERLKVYYAGRGGFQKHLELVFEIARRCIRQKLPMDFHFAGTFEDEIPEDVKQHINWHGMIGSEEEMYRLHEKMDVLLLTSRYEGFPLAIMEAMSCGVAIVATSVDGIPEHITPGVNGFLMTSTDDDKIVSDGVSYLEKLANDRELLDSVSHNNYRYAQEHFSRDIFVRSYRKLFEIDN